jgi:Aldo/keto reductase family
VQEGVAGPVQRSARAYIEEVLPDVLDGTLEPGRVFDRTISLEAVPDGYRAMAAREALKVLIRPSNELLRPAARPYTNEELVGRALAGGHRDRSVLATKVGLISGPSAAAGSGSNSPGAARDGRPEHIRASIDGSLRRLGTDHVDLYQLHRVDPRVPLEETWGVMAETVAAGKARHIGLSEVTVEEIRRAQTVHPVTSVQSDLPHDDFRRGLPRFQQDALRANLGIVARVREIAGRIGGHPGRGRPGMGAGPGPVRDTHSRHQDP